MPHLQDPNTSVDISVVGPMNIDINSLNDLLERREYINAIIKNYHNLLMYYRKIK